MKTVHGGLQRRDRALTIRVVVVPVFREELVHLVPEDNRRLVFLGNLVHERNELLRVAVVRGPDVTDGRRDQSDVVSLTACLDRTTLSDVCFTRTCNTVRDIRRL